MTATALPPNSFRELVDKGVRRVPMRLHRLPFQAAAFGDVTPTEAHLIEIFVKSIEASEILRRLQALEASSSAP
jgi:hypothetical protein